jgi:hypothetical protein
VKLLSFAGILLVWAASASAVDVLTYHNDNFRSGSNPSETILTLSNVNMSQFGKAFSHSLDGYVYAQPLVLTNVAIPGLGTHDVLYVVTEHNSVYAFDADDALGPNANPLWQVSLGTPATSGDVSCTDLIPEVGISGTPVIDPGTGTMYLVAKSKVGSNFFQNLHALDVTTGAEKFGGPKLIQISGPIAFDPLIEHNRPGLLLLNGVVYIAFASHCDNGPYYGWILGYDATTLAQVYVFNTAPNNQWTGVWMSGDGVAADASNNLYFSTGNGPFDNTTGDYGDSVLSLRTGGPPTVASFFTPHEQALLWQFDTDLGSGGVVLLPDQPTGGHPHLLITSGKEGVIYLIDRDNMGGYDPNADHCVQTIPNANGGVWGSPAFFNDLVYFGAQSDYIKAFQLSNGMLSTTPFSTSNLGFGYPGPSPTISANGTSDGILWAIDSQDFTRGILYALNAVDLTVELWDSEQAGTRDRMAGGVKFSAPTIANGKVYAASQYEVDAYGLLTCVANAASATNSGPVCPGQTLQLFANTVAGATYSWTGPNGFTSNQQNPTITNVTFADAGDYVLTLTAPGCTPTNSTTTAAVVSPPAPTLNLVTCLTPNTAGLGASANGSAADTYTWTLTGGTITSGQGTNAIVFTSGPAGTLMSIGVTETTPYNCSGTTSGAIQVNFDDVPGNNPFFTFICTIARNGVTGGCGGSNFCPGANVLRSQMAVFLLRSEHGSAYNPPACTVPAFTDVPCSNPFASWIYQLVAEGITSGCTATTFCPNDPVLRDSMAVFLLVAEHGPGYTPFVCTPPGQFSDVPCPGGGFTDWIYQLVAEGITGGCTATMYCPMNPVTRDQMSVFLVTTFNLP